ncbi:RNA-binding protein 39-like isoform X2 [Babylonia areolata]|uniref:RNA-binding protein 39-like isoform X2 n=1 Tax=Babylonia areolata TaxID=304850 RepID=UPI003FD333E5
MAEDFDVEAMLEAPYMKEMSTVTCTVYQHPGLTTMKENGVEESSSSSKSKKKKKKSRSRSRDRSRRDRRSRSRDRRSRSRDRRSRSRDRDRRDRRRSRSRSRGRNDRDRRRSPPRGTNRRSRSRERFGRRGMSPLRGESKVDMTPEERDARTVFCMQLSARIRARDLEEFFSSVGKVTDVRLITDNKSRRSKGIAYIEFKDIESVPLAMALSGQKLLGVPILVQASQAEKNRLSGLTTSLMTSNNRPPSAGPMRLYVGSLHFNITEDMLKGIFEPFGKVDDVKLIRDHETGRSQGYGFLTFRNPEDAKKALEQLNGFELAGRPMKVGNVTERTGLDGSGNSALDTDEMDRAGIDLGATGRLQLMAKLAEGTGFQIPQYAASALSQAGNPQMSMTPPFSQLPAIADPANGPPTSNIPAPPITTQCFMLSNMFDSGGENRLNWDQEIRDDVIEECNKHGGVLHIYVDKSSPQGNVYVKCPTIAAAAASVNALHGRYFGGRVITAAYVPLPNYSALFADSVRASQPLIPSGQTLQSNFTSGFSMAPSL